MGPRVNPVLILGETSPAVSALRPWPQGQQRETWPSRFPVEKLSFQMEGAEGSGSTGSSPPDRRAPQRPAEAKQPEAAKAHLAQLCAGSEAVCDLPPFQPALEALGSASAPRP